MSQMMDIGRETKTRSQHCLFYVVQNSEKVNPLRNMPISHKSRTLCLYVEHDVPFFTDMKREISSDFYGFPFSCRQGWTYEATRRHDVNFGGVVHVQNSEKVDPLRHMLLNDMMLLIVDMMFLNHISVACCWHYVHMFLSQGHDVDIMFLCP